jgi:hypothetical protein
MTPSYEALTFFGKPRYAIAEASVNYARKGCEGYEVFTFKDGSFIEIDPHFGHQQAFAPNRWNITPRN